MGVLVPGFAEAENLEYRQLPATEDNPSAFLRAH